MVDGVPLLLLLVPGEQRKIDDPEEIQGSGAFERVEHFGDAQADAAEGFAGDFPFVGTEQNEVAFLDGEALGESGFFGVGEEFDDRGFPLAVLDLDEGEAFRTGLLGEFGEVFDLARGDAGEARGIDGFHHAAVVECATEDFELRVAEDISEVGDLHAKAGVGFVTAEAVHRVLVGKSREGCRDFDAFRLAEDSGDDFFHQREDFVLRGKRGLDIELGEFGLAVSAQILVAEAAGDLEILFHTGDHEELLVLLRGLRERVERSGREA